MTSAESTDSAIPARTQRQAMDWSLVLFSQGIESVIEEVEGGWALLIPASDHHRATEVIRQYQRENRGWRWRQGLSWPAFSFHFGALIWCAVLVGFHWLSSLPGTRLRELGILHSQAVLNGAWWQLFTALTLHQDVAHLMANLTTGFLLLGLAMGRYGPACALLASCLAGAAGNLTGVLLRSEPYPGLGASGMVMGALGLLAIQSISFRRSGPGAAKYAVAGLLGGVMLFVLLGLSPNPATDVLAHLGGFVAGLLLGGLMDWVPHETLITTKVNVGAGIVLGFLLVTTWTLALK